MVGRGRRAALGGVAVALSCAAAGGVVAGTQSSDERALQPTRQGASWNVERRVDSLLRKMTLPEELDQIQQLSDGQINDTEAAKPVGGVFSLTDPERINHFQHIAVEQSRLHIPILFA